MTLLYRCDGCEQVLSEDKSRYAVDFLDYSPAIEGSDGLSGEAEEVALLSVALDAEFHFCTPACLASWAFSREIDPAR